MNDAKLKLVVLCVRRDRPFAARIRSASVLSINENTGLAEMKSGCGTLIAFATGPGKAALDGDPGPPSRGRGSLTSSQKPSQPQPR
jgi:hypothetical protein